MTTANETAKPTVYLDGACPPCRREIGVYRRRDTAGAIDWVDNSVCTAATLAADLYVEDAKARFCLRRADGTLVSRAAAFAEMWASTPGFRASGRIAKVRPVTRLLDAAYRGFLRIRPSLQILARRIEARSSAR